MPERVPPLHLSGEEINDLCGVSQIADDVLIERQTMVHKAYLTR